MPISCKRRTLPERPGPRIDDPQAVLWALRALLFTPAHNGFVKDGAFGKNEVLEWLGFPPLSEDSANIGTVLEKF
ncbi:MAG: hypothetical protein HQL98_14800 [Magnetococcales bacterium]|nr:hypothetical protein [Magnetococcales bacterium]